MDAATQHLSRNRLTRIAEPLDFGRGRELNEDHKHFSVANLPNSMRKSDSTPPRH